MVAAVLVNTEAMLAELPKKNAPAAGMPPGRWHVGRTRLRYHYHHVFDRQRTFDQSRPLAQLRHQAV
jgi:hypothetical protein